jgi:hypothetical protein
MNNYYAQWVATALVLSAVAMVAQAIVFFAILKVLKRLNERVTVFIPRAEAALVSAEKSLAESKNQIVEAMTKANAVLDSTQAQLARFDGLVGDATEKARHHMERAELILEDSLDRIHKTVVQVNEVVLWPLKEVSGVAAGVRAALGALFRPGRPNVAQATADEEMFI